MRFYITIFVIFAFLAMYLLFKGSTIEPLETLPNPATQPILQPKPEILTPPKMKPRNEPLPVPTATDAENFLNLIARSGSREHIFETPGKHVIARPMGKHWVTQGDLLVDEAALLNETSNFEIRIAKLDPIKRWPGGIVPYQIDSHVIPQSILEAISSLHRDTNLRFVERTNEADFISFEAHEAQTCLSYLGRKGGRQEILLNQSICGFGNILHEILHAAGLIHEHSREDRDNYLEIHWDAIAGESHDQFQKLSSEFMPPNAEEFDFDSIMLYSSRAFATRDAPSITKRDGTQFDANRAGLSAGDIQKINALYPSDR